MTDRRPGPDAQTRRPRVDGCHDSGRSYAHSAPGPMCDATPHPRDAWLTAVPASAPPSWVEHGAGSRGGRPASYPLHAPCGVAACLWQQYLADPRQRLTPRALRYLCWEPQVATASRFQDCLDQSAGELSTRMLQGLVRSCHACWSPTFAAGGVARRVQQRLVKYRGVASRAGPLA